MSVPNLSCMGTYIWNTWFVVLRCHWECSSRGSFLEHPEPGAAPPVGGEVVAAPAQVRAPLERGGIRSGTTAGGWLGGLAAEWRRDGGGVTSR
jgi:hypothetical protein